MLIQAALNPKQDGADAGQPASFAEQIRRGIMSMQFFMRSITKG